MEWKFQLFKKNASLYLCGFSMIKLGDNKDKDSENLFLRIG